MTIAIIDYGSGNLRSVAKAVEHVAGTAQHKTARNVAVTADPRAVAAASHVILPGVGAFGDCARGLAAIPGMIEALTRHAMEQHKPFLGICVGMQLLFEEGHEHGVHKGLGWFSGRVVKLTPRDATLKIPHMGWNELQLHTPDHKLLKGITPGAHAYFVHSYHAETPDMLASVDYGGPVCAMVARENVAATQFHPEKSQKTGLTLLHNFVHL